MMKTVVIAAALLAASPALAQGWQSRPGQTHWLRTGGVACHNREPLDVIGNRYLSRMQRISALQEYEASGDCILLPARTFVTVRFAHGGKACVTIQGSDRCNWMMDPALANAPDPW